LVFFHGIFGLPPAAGAEVGTASSVAGPFCDPTVRPGLLGASVGGGLAAFLRTCAEKTRRQEGIPRRTRILYIINYIYIWYDTHLVPNNLFDLVSNI
jgi:hypothetical protein